MKKRTKKIAALLFSTCVLTTGMVPVSAQNVEYTTTPGTAWEIPLGSQPQGLEYIAGLDCSHIDVNSRSATAKITFKTSPFEIKLTGKIYYMPPSPYNGDWILMHENTRQSYGAPSSSMSFNLSATIPYDTNGMLKYPTGGEWLVEFSWAIRSPDEEIWRTDDVTLWNEYKNFDDESLYIWNDGDQIYL